MGASDGAGSGWSVVDISITPWMGPVRGCVDMPWFSARRREDFRPVSDPTDSYSEWDQGWRLLVAAWSSLIIVLLGLLHLTLVLEVLGCLWN